MYRRYLDRSISVLTRLIPIYLEVAKAEDQEDLKSNIRSMLGSMEGMLNSMDGFRQAVAGLPRLTSSLARSKRETEKILQEVIDITRGAVASMETALSMLAQKT